MAPPRKVIKALYDFKPTQPEELTFSKGDFFHVVGNEDDEDWYEAANPITGARGYVPVNYFQILEKSAPSGGGVGLGGKHQQQRYRQRNSDQSLEDSGNDSGAFTDPPQPYQQHHQGHHHHQQHHAHQARAQGHTHSTSSVSVAAASAVAPVNISPSLSQTSSTGMSMASPQPPVPKCQPLYGIVLYDFGAERTDELDAKAGDAILVIAQSNEDWYVAKPIGRLGGPGLIPVNFIEIRDMVTGKPINVAEMLKQTGTAIPRVEEWKKQAMEYRANSIPLGRIEDAAQQQQQPQQPVQQQQPSQTYPSQQQQQQYRQQQNGGPTIQQLKNKLSRDLKQQQQQQQNGHNRHQSEDVSRRVDTYSRPILPPTNRSYTDAFEDSQRNSRHSQQYQLLDPSRVVVDASVESFHHEDDQYWFTVRVEMENGAIRSLFRLYEDFYNFHIALLEEFPVESGRTGGQARILPFIPIPLQQVTDIVTASRRVDLNEYVHELCRLPTRITHHPLIEQLFEVKDGDTEMPPPPSQQPHLSTISTSTTATTTTKTDRRTSPTTQLGNATTHNNNTTTSTTNTNGGSTTNTTTNARANLRAAVSAASASVGHVPAVSTAALTVGSTSATVPGAGVGTGSSGMVMTSGTMEEMVKIKIAYLDDIMAMRIPTSISLEVLRKRIFERLGIDNDKNLSYRDDRGGFATLQRNADIKKAIERSGGKLMIYVD
ncbi:bud emergence protein 1 [Entomortierella parvispora]|uniref:Bud emergence protein 1 n=1 Tax=Entomortierella parvispora TaxID=205924 RepID=A0A9P3LT92_9FUNG|nr:bud emergence protein 1 [Entomortierella parvispora]